MMWAKSLALLAGAIPFGLALVNPCPLDGPVFPKPAKLSQMPIIQEAVANLTQTFTDWNSNDNTTDAFSYSIQIFSAWEDDPIFLFNHTAPNLAKIKHSGVTTVDQDTVYRLGSLTKVFTVYNFLLNAGDKIWSQPITNYIPELAAIANRSSQDPVMYTDWNEITIGSLAAQLSGIPRDYALLGELTQMGNTAANVLKYGFPPLPESQIPPCGDTPLCNRTQFFEGIANFYPSVAAFQTPVYSDIGFQLLGYALEQITGQDYGTLLQDTVLTPLNLSHTYYSSPPQRVGIIPGNVNATKWSFQLGDESPAGNMYSSAADMAAFGKAILSYKQLTPVMTRRWLKPFSFSSDFKASVGAPWGVRRIPLGNLQQDRETTGYNKAGGIGSYQAAFIVVPDYDIGFSIMVSGNIPGNTNWNIADMMGEIFIPAVNTAAKNQAALKYAGRYAVANGTMISPNSTRALNSSLVITTDNYAGLSVAKWFSNGTDFRTTVVSLQVTYTPGTPSIRLYPTALTTPTDDGGKKTVFKALFEDLDVPAQVDKMFSTDCGSWVGVESVIYGSQSADEFIFYQNADGAITSVEIPALRITLLKVTG